MAVTANQLIVAQNPRSLVKAPVAASTRLYQGTLAFTVHDSGYADDDIDSGANYFAGIVKEDADNSSGSAGDVNAELYTEGVFELTGSGFTQAAVGEKIFASDNYTITLTATSNVRIGNVVEFISSTRLRVQIKAGNQADLIE